MQRPFELRKAPPINLEVKYGKKNNKGWPQRLEHFLVVEREKDGKGREANFKVREDVHKALKSTKPTSIPIVLMSDDLTEVFSLYRALFIKGQLACGARYGSKTAMRRFKNKEVVPPFEVDCSSECPFWKSTNKGAQCDISGTFYFRLHESLPHSDKFAACRIRGTFAQRYLTSSLDMLSRQSDGILANIPLALQMHTEWRQASDGKTYGIPLISVQPLRGQAQFFRDLEEEIKRRAIMFRLKYNREHNDIEELRIKNILSEISSRGVADEAEFMSADFAEDDLDVVEEDLKDKYDDIPSKKLEILVSRFTDTEGNLNEQKLDEAIKKERERQLDF